MFDDRALGEIYNHSTGVPRLINSICDRALLTGFIREKWQINKDVINEVAGELRLNKKKTGEKNTEEKNG